MALTEIEYGSLASSEVMNNNFEYLDNRISELSESQIAGLASVNSNIVSINATLSSLGDSVDESVEEINTALDEIGSMVEASGLYVTTYINGASWCREYFSDKDKTTRLWMVQVGHSSYWNSQFQTRTISFVKNFSSVCNVTGILVGPGGADDSNQGVASWSTSSFVFVHRGWGSGVSWVAFGK